MYIVALVFWISFTVLIHTYLLYPLLLYVLFLVKKKHDFVPEAHYEPFVSVLISAYNEQSLIEQKIQTVLQSDYKNFEILIGSDASTDATNDIIERMGSLYPQVTPFVFEQRSGKPNVINRLAGYAKGNLLVITDANVMWKADTLSRLVQCFSDPSVGLVDSCIEHHNLSNTGISAQENKYISLETHIKYYEGELWGCSMGAFGACFALRKSLYRNVPDNFLVDDFFISMNVLQQGFKNIIQLQARVTEDVSNNPHIEFRRKVRIAAGNFQNLRYFSHLFMFWRYRTKFIQKKHLLFSYLSHKVLRWMSPFFLINVFLSSILLFNMAILYKFAAVFLLLSVCFSLLDVGLRKYHVHIVYLRYITHFYTTNWSIIKGFLKYIGGIQSNAWQPTQRNQS